MGSHDVSYNGSQDGMIEVFKVQAIIGAMADCLFVCGISLTSGQLIIELFPDCLKVMLFASCFCAVWMVTAFIR